MPDKLAKFPQVDAWIQIACPRLSIDWGHFYAKPLLSSYEAFAMLGEARFPNLNDRKDTYPMDFYSYEGGRWTNYWKRN
jgi:2-(3-amino-3-carboxypropyl)histidine synthase